MHTFIAGEIVKQMIRMGKNVSTSTFVMLGLTFKENVPDIRNSKVASLYNELKEFGITPLVYDPLADAQEVKHEYGIDLVKKEDLPQADTLIVAVAHKEFTQMKETDLKVMMNHDNLLVVDIKHLYNKKLIEDLGMTYWSL